MKICSVLILIILSFLKITIAQNYKIITLDSGKNTSIRGLSVVNNKVAWVSGSNGWIAKTTNGETFEWQQLKGFEKIDFRDIEAFSAKEAIIVNAGSPAYILKTIDGGQSWKKVYENNDPSIFLDGMAFWNKKEGIIFGDPINGLMQILTTKNGGESWENISAKAQIQLLDGEAAFAASGTTIRTHKNKVYIATGGKTSRLWSSINKGQTWTAVAIPIIKGEASTGTFSIAISNSKIFAVGGDYLKEKSLVDNYTHQDRRIGEWGKSIKSPNGYRSAIEVISENNLIATGPSGTDFSDDEGKTWQTLSLAGFHTCQKAKKGNLVLFTGSKGKIAMLSYKK
ncbi:WD40/YVTN/BNR-like repeat-containing protein [Pedobacter cryophilus]|uniref:Oxidoreductase n=1 Tax=Pedobacter cryophilus TaxID=2571271 RepID=A0A4U1BU60_9SPHI|nr:YCF48-related protein [Pedobacter cryophilus]TKB95140.1 oxidoreductase [Pedobacter cryophilus]